MRSDNTLRRAMHGVAAAVLASACMTVAAQGTGLTNVRTTTMPEVHQSNGVPWVTGGIGDENRQRTEELGRSMNTELVFAQTRGEFLADVKVDIADANGRPVLTVDAADPLLFANLAPGRYRVAATVDGERIERTIEVPRSGRHTEHFRWHAQGATPGR